MKKQMRLQPLMVVLATVLLCLSACQKDEITEVGTTTDKSGVSIVSAKEVPALNSFLSSEKMRRMPTKSLGGNDILETPFGYVPLNDILEVVDAGQNTNYTFKILPKVPEPDSFYNLIVNPNVDGQGTTAAYVMKYEMDPGFTQDYFFGRKSMGDYNGTISKYPLDGFIDTVVSKSGELPCACIETTTTNGFGGSGGFGGGNGNDGPDDGDTENTGNNGGNGTATGGTNSGGGGCRIYVIRDCGESTQREGLSDRFFQGGGYNSCIPIGIIQQCTYKSAFTTKTNDCQTNADGSCPGDAGEFGVDAAGLFTYLTLAPEHGFWMLDSANESLVNEMGNLLHRFSVDEQALEAATALVENVSILYATDVLTKPQALELLKSKDVIDQITVRIADPCEYGIVANAKNTPSTVNDHLFDIAGTQESQFDLQYVEGNLGGDLGLTSLYPDCYTADKCFFTIRMDSDFLATGTDLSIATVVIHENIHAILSHALYVDDITTNENDDYTLLELARVYARFRATIFDGDDRTWPRDFQTPLSEAHHVYIIELINQIEEAIRTYGENAGYQLDDDYYEALAWTGLEELRTFEDKIPEESERKKIKAIILAEQTNTNVTEGGVTTVPQGKPASAYENCN